MSKIHFCFKSFEELIDVYVCQRSCYINKLSRLHLKKHLLLKFKNSLKLALFHSPIQSKLIPIWLHPWLLYFYLMLYSHSHEIINFIIWKCLVVKRFKSVQISTFCSLNSQKIVKKLKKNLIWIDQMSVFFKVNNYWSDLIIYIYV